jgi:hypothetical protein
MVTGLDVLGPFSCRCVCFTLSMTSRSCSSSWPKYLAPLQTRTPCTNVSGVYVSLVARQKQWLHACDRVLIMRAGTFVAGGPAASASGCSCCDALAAEHTVLQIAGTYFLLCPVPYPLLTCEPRSELMACRGCTRVLVTHQTQWLHACDRVLVMRAGAIVADGPWSRLQADPLLPILHRPAQDTALDADDPESGAGPRGDSPAYGTSDAHITADEAGILRWRRHIFDPTASSPIAAAPLVPTTQSGARTVALASAHKELLADVDADAQASQHAQEMWVPRPAHTRSPENAPEALDQHALSAQIAPVPPEAVGVLAADVEDVWNAPEASVQPSQGVGEPQDHPETWMMLPPPPMMGVNPQALEQGSAPLTGSEMAPSAAAAAENLALDVQGSQNLPAGSPDALRSHPLDTRDVDEVADMPVMRRPVAGVKSGSSSELGCMYGGNRQKRENADGLNGAFVIGMPPSAAPTVAPHLDRRSGGGSSGPIRLRGASWWGQEGSEIDCGVHDFLSVTTSRTHEWVHALGTDVGDEGRDEGGGGEGHSEEGDRVMSPSSLPPSEPHTRICPITPSTPAKRQVAGAGAANVAMPTAVVADGHGLTTREHREEGKVSAGVYGRYFSVIGLPASAVVMGALILGQITWILSEWWLAKWSQAAPSEQGRPKWMIAYGSLVAGAHPSLSLSDLFHF